MKHVPFLVAAASLGFALPAAAEPPLRKGFTLELGLGASFTHVATQDVQLASGAPGVASVDPRRADHVGLAPLSLSLGGFVSPDVAILGRLAGTSWFPGGGVQRALAFLGPVVQGWLSDSVVLAGGVGLGQIYDNPFLETSLRTTTRLLAFNGRIGWAALTEKHHALGFALEVFPAFGSGITALGAALELNWQYF